MLSRLARWWLDRAQRKAKPPARRFDECTTCGGVASHTIVELFDDGIEAEAAGAGGGTGMSADYCPEHCPGGCLQGCARIEA